MFNLDVRNNADELFDEAIKQKVLSKNENDTNYAGNFMYMYSKKMFFSEKSKHFFKNIDTRNYLTVEF